MGGTELLPRLIPLQTLNKEEDNRVAMKANQVTPIATGSPLLDFRKMK